VMPALVMGLLTFLAIALAVFSIALYNSHDGAPAAFPVVCIILSLIFGAEAIIYWVIRKRDYSKLLAWLHVGLTVLSFFVPFLAIFVHNDSHGATVHGAMYAGLFLLSFLFLLSGIVLFIVAVVKSNAIVSADTGEEREEDGVSM
ncbi:MAG: hypothetical protein JST39_02845, partial [Bacteroidetes bacterium]|nr:hypothetical protein [Bacteroidota bacterium]